MPKSDHPGNRSQLNDIEQNPVTLNIIGSNSSKNISFQSIIDHKMIFLYFPADEVPPDEVSLNALITALGSGRQWPQALHALVSVASAASLQRSVVSFDAAIAAMEPWRSELA